MVRGKAEICFLHIKSGGTLAASAQENIRRKKQILHRILRSGGLPYVSMPSPSRLGSAQNLRFSDANSFANIFHIKSLPHSVYGGDFFRFNPTSKKSLAKPHVFLCGGTFCRRLCLLFRFKNARKIPRRCFGQARRNRRRSFRNRRPNHRRHHLRFRRNPCNRSFHLRRNRPRPHHLRQR